MSISKDATTQEGQVPVGPPAGEAWPGRHGRGGMADEAPGFHLNLTKLSGAENSRPRGPANTVAPMQGDRHCGGR